MADVADLVADDGHQLGVVHHVHQAGIHPDGSVAAGKSIDLVGLVDFQVDGDPVDAFHVAHQFAEALVIRTTVDLVHGIHIGDRLGAQLRDLFVGNGQGRHGRTGGGGQRCGVETGAGKDTARSEHREGGDKGKKVFFHGLKDINLQIYKKNFTMSLRSDN